MNSNYFPHYLGARNHPKILMLRGKYDDSGYAKFFMMAELLAESSNGYISREVLPGIAISLNTTPEELIDFIEYCLKIGVLEEDKNGIFSARMMEYINFRKERSRSGKRGAISRWKHTSAMQEPMAEPLAEPMQVTNITKRTNITNTTSKPQKLSKALDKNSPIDPITAALQLSARVASERGHYAGR